MSYRIHQFSVINLTHIRKSCSKFINILTHQRIGCKTRNMIFDQHKITCAKIRIYTTRCICQKKNFRSHHVHQSDRKYYIRNRIAFIIMNSSFHADYRNIFYITKNKFTSMPWYGRYRKLCNLRIIKFCFNTNIVCIITKTRSKYNCYFRLDFDFIFNTFITSFYFFIHFIHIASSIILFILYSHVVVLYHKKDAL